MRKRVGYIYDGPERHRDITICQDCLDERDRMGQSDGRDPDPSPGWYEIEPSSTDACERCGDLIAYDRPEVRQYWYEDVYTQVCEALMAVERALRRGERLDEFIEHQMSGKEIMSDREWRAIANVGAVKVDIDDPEPEPEQVWRHFCGLANTLEITRDLLRGAIKATAEGGA